MKKIRVGINGFGRIGRIAARIIVQRKNSDLVAINSRADAASHAYLLKYDSTYGILSNSVKADGNNLIIDNSKVTIFSKDMPSDIPWKETGVDIVIDSTGKFRTAAELSGHILAGAQRVVLSAPAKDGIKTLVFGVNEKTYDPNHDKIISNSSCTTNCLATTLKVLHDHFRVVQGFMTTTHALTDSQNLLDNSHKNGVRLARSSISSMIPAQTGSANDIGKLFPDLTGKIICQAIRVPLPTVSLINLVVEVKKEATKQSLNAAFLDASRSSMKGIVDVAKEELVSKDFTGNPHSAIVDPYLTQVLSSRLVSVSAWYDNEWGYTSRLIDIVEYVGRHI